MASCCGCLLIIINFVFLALGLAVTIVGAYIWYKVGSVIAWMPIIITFTGVGIMLVVIFGFLGLGYDKTKPQENCLKKWFLLVYFFVLLLLGLVLGIMSTLCLVAWEKIMAIVKANLPALIQYFQMQAERADIAYEKITNLVMANLKVVGGLGLFIAGCLLFGILVSGWLLGVEVFVHTITFGNMILAGAGGIVVGFGIYVYVTGVVDGRALPLVIGIGGIVICIIALIGFFAACGRNNSCCRKMICIYAVILILLVLLALICGIVAAAFTDTVSAQIEKLCNGNGTIAGICTDTFTLICDKAYQCDPATVSAADIIAAVKGFVIGNMRMVAAGAIWLGCAMVYLIVAAFIVFCAGANPEEPKNPQPKPAQQMQAAAQPTQPHVTPAPGAYGAAPAPAGYPYPGQPAPQAYPGQPQPQATYGYGQPAPAPAAYGMPAYGAQPQ